MIHGENNLTFTFIQQPQRCIATITIPSACVMTLYNEALRAQQAQAETYGFSKGTTPLYYIEQTFRPNILEHLKELLFTHYVMRFLCQSLHKNKLVTVGDPQLIDISLQPEKETCFVFALQVLTLESAERWKKLSLRAPERKHYKDLDRQVESFIKEETNRQQTTGDESIMLGDWVCFELFLADNNKKQLLPHTDELWVRISEEEADRELHELFVGKKRDELFYSQSSFLQAYMSNEFSLQYLFGVRIKDYTPHAYFSFEHFKRHFYIKNSRELHQKLIEIFSYRNDLSQRRETVEATLKLLLRNYFVSLPQQLLEQQRQTVLSVVHANPDYHVYKAQSDFKEKVRQLAEKQLKETIIIDTIAYQEDLHVNHDDLLCYLNFTKRQRTKDFIYFGLPSTKLKGQEIPVSTEVLKQYCLREKTLNHVIYNLTRKTK